MDNGEVVSTRVAARALGLSPRTLVRMIDTGIGPVALRPGKRLLKIKRASLDEFIEARTVRPRGVSSAPHR
jgi:excisionase family DNA binding protein